MKIRFLLRGWASRFVTGLARQRSEIFQDHRYVQTFRRAQWARVHAALASTSTASAHDMDDTYLPAFRATDHRRQAAVRHVCLQFAERPAGVRQHISAAGSSTP